MTQSSSGFMDFLAEEVKKYKGIYVPVRSGLLRHLLVRKLPCKKIHPNPDDEFCKPEVGPNFEIISKYKEQFRQAKAMGEALQNSMEPLIVERIKPDGYILLNGHHRWAAAIQSGLAKVPVRITSLPNRTDIQQMLMQSKNSQRAVLDLDEVVFADGDSALPAEKALPVPLRAAFPQRLRLGIPGLFHFLNVNGYDVWVYSKSYYSLEYIKALFRTYHVRVNGIVTGTARKRAGIQEAREKVEEMIMNHYDATLTIDRDALLRVNHRTKKYRVCQLSGKAEGWSAEVIEKARSLEKDE